MTVISRGFQCAPVLRVALASIAVPRAFTLSGCAAIEELKERFLNARKATAHLLRITGVLWLKTTTQRVRRNVLERFRAEHGHRPLKDLQSSHVRGMIGAKANTSEAANNLLK